MKLIDLDALGVGMANPAAFENRAHADGWNSLYCILQQAPAVAMEPQKFLEKAKRIFEEEGRDVEAFHDSTDILMEDLLIDLGYRDGIEFIRSKERWYA